MQARTAGVALARPPAHTRTLVAHQRGVYIWPGIALTVQRGAEIIPIADAAIRFWIALLHGSAAIHKELVWAVANAARFLKQENESAAQRVLGHTGPDLCLT